MILSIIILMTLPHQEMTRGLTPVDYEGFNPEDDLTPQERCARALANLFSNNTAEENLAALSQEGLDDHEFLDLLMKLTNHNQQPQDLVRDLIDITNILCPDPETNDGRQPTSLQEKLITIYSEIVDYQ